jgi:hypothetical protein
MSDFENDKLKLQALEFESEEFDEEEEEEEIEEIEIDTALFAEQALRFPCFHEAPRDKPSDELFDIIFSAYQDENLTEEQDHVVELLLHLQEEESPFHLSRAMEVWSHDNREAFLGLLQELHTMLDGDEEPATDTDDE